MIEIRVKVVKPGDKVKPPPKPTYEEIGLRHQMSQFYSLKARFEDLFGHPIYIELKETTDLAVWRRAMKKLLDAIALSVKCSVQVADDDWHKGIADALSRGKDGLKQSRTAADLFASVSATLIEVVFTLIGFMPTRASMRKTAPLAKDYWQMHSFRTVQYVQTAAQRQALQDYKVQTAERHVQS